MSVLPGDIPPLIAAYPWDYKEALSVVYGTPNCEYGESGGDPNATSPAGHRGLYQIGWVHIERIRRLGFTWDDMLLAEPNIAVAYDLQSEQGWTPWTCRP